MQVNKQVAIAAKNGDVLHHKTIENIDGTPMRARVVRQCKTVKGDSVAFVLPVKHGRYTSFQITNENAGDWATTAEECVSDEVAPARKHYMQRILDDDRT